MYAMRKKRGSVKRSPTICSDIFMKSQSLINDFVLGNVILAWNPFAEPITGATLTNFEYSFGTVKE